MTTEPNPTEKPKPAAMVDKPKKSLCADCFRIFGEFFLFFLGCALLTALVFLPFTSGKLADFWAPATQEDWGTVQSIRYVSSFAPTTQLETESRTFLLKGIVNIDKGTRVHKREDFFSREVCVEGSKADSQPDRKRCWDLLGN